MTAVLVTGADGYLGRRIIGLLLADDSRELIAAVRASDRQELARKAAGLRDGHERSDRIRVVPVDVGRDDAFEALATSAGDITHIVHAAAITRFDVDRDAAESVNVLGAQRVLDFAQRCSSLQSLTHLSTIYATGLHEGEIQERSYDDSAGFANEYEWSKWQAEQRVQAMSSRLPVRIGRVATVIADDLSGRVGQYNVFHQTLKLCFHGLLSIVPGDPRTPVHLIAGDFAAESIVAVMAHPDASGYFHVAHAVDDAMSLQELLDLAFEEFGRDATFNARRILPPLLADHDTFRLLLDGHDQAGSLVGRSLGSMACFAPQLYRCKRVSNGRLLSVLPQYAPPRCRDLAVACCEHLIATGWGRRSAA